MKAIALGFEKKKDLVVRTIHLPLLTESDIRILFCSNRRDPVIGVSFPIQDITQLSQVEFLGGKELPTHLELDWFIEYVDEDYPCDKDYDS